MEGRRLWSEMIDGSRLAEEGEREEGVGGGREEERVARVSLCSVVCAECKCSTHPSPLSSPKAVI